ncbi:BQ2448_1385 [Microbotryum intermedium]|uniref:BQ2448_1385 protein n=1 Tax=Microbotryum intermedium TaxID=269621 RepID=A0A238FD01_9BASI|nr:BQ2448_1385 [Microbotryum intermedium]
MKRSTPVDEQAALLGSMAPPPYHIIDDESNQPPRVPSPAGTPIYYVCTPSTSLPHYPLPRVSSSPFSSMHRLPAGPSPFNALPLPIASALAHQQSLRHADARARGRVIRGVGVIVENEQGLERWTQHKWRGAKRWSQHHRWGVEPQLDGREKGRWSRPLSDDSLQVRMRTTGAPVASSTMTDDENAIVCAQTLSPSPEVPAMPSEPSEAISTKSTPAIAACR